MKWRIYSLGIFIRTRFKTSLCIYKHVQSHAKLIVAARHWNFFWRLLIEPAVNHNRLLLKVDKPIVYPINYNEQSTIQD